MAKKVALILCSIGFVLISCEFVVRYQLEAWPFERPRFAPPHLTPRDDSLRWRFSPRNNRNSLGLRNREIGPKAQGTCRILFLGDSLIWSGETSSERLFTEVLEVHLNARLADGATTFEVINAGIPGYTTFQELEFLKIYGLDLKPDIIVLGFVFNDLHYKYLHKSTRRKLLDREPAVNLFHFNPYTFPGLLFARSYLAHELARRVQILWKRFRQRPLFTFEQREDFYLAWKDYGWIHVRRLIGEMQRLANSAHASMMVIVFPISDQVNEKYRQMDEKYLLFPQSMIRRICKDYSIPLVDLTDRLYRSGGEKLFKDYLHLTPQGNDLVAAELENYFVKNLGAALPCPSKKPSP